MPRKSNWRVTARRRLARHKHLIVKLFLRFACLPAYLGARAAWAGLRTGMCVTKERFNVPLDIWQFLIVAEHFTQLLALTCTRFRQKDIIGIWTSAC